MARQRKTRSDAYVQFFDSIGEFHGHIAKLGNVHGTSNGSFTGHESFEESLANVLKGRLQVVPRAEALLDKLAADSIQLERATWELAVVGAFPCVPALLSGSPEAMWGRVMERSEQSPVKVFASICCSAGVSAEKLEARGIAILALCQKLSAIRPVELWIYADLGSFSGGAQIPVIKIETSPLDLSTATYTMTAAGFLRHLCFNFGHPHGYDGSWAWGGDPTDEDNKRRTRALIGASDDDLLVPGGYLHDPLIDRPVEWINEQIAKYAPNEEEA